MKRQDLLTSHNQLERARLAAIDANKTARETEETAIQVAAMLNTQRDSINRIGGQVAGVDNQITASRSIMGSMLTRAKARTLGMGLLAVVLAALIVMMIYLMM